MSVNLISPSRIGFLDYWGKARPNSPAAPSWHRLAYHMLDVGAVGRVLLEKDPRLAKAIATSARLSEGEITGFLPFILALHDLGKFAEGFQDLRRDLSERLQPGRPERPYRPRHDSMGFRLWSDSLCSVALERGWFNLRVGGATIRDLGEFRDVVEPWFRAATGHHGAPPNVDPFGRATLLFSERAIGDARDFVRAAVELFCPPGLSFPAEINAEKVLCSSAWSVAGLAVLCDWLGSNQEHFPYCSEELALEDYWRTARSRAECAVQESGVLPSKCSGRAGFRELFPAIKEPSPLQDLASTMPLSKGPQLIIIEEVTGGGKTEAALVLAHRFIGDGLADGVYVALPTMATANAMHTRVGPIYRQFYEKGETPSLVLAHSATRLAGLRLETPARDRPYVTTRDDSREDSASVHCAAWLSDNRKKALLAAVGVGTIDQALLGILPSRHSPLRLLGLQRNVLLVDEVHCYDSYVARLLERLIEFQVALGGSVILLSATLPNEMRRRFVVAFQKGLTGRTLGSLASTSYPLVTHVDSNRINEIPIACRESSARSVAVEFLEDPAVAVSEVVAAAEERRCVCWIRNSVADAIESFEELRKIRGPGKVTLFHARLMMGDRLRIEKDVLGWFGPKSTSADRAGRILIATQVVEQSLDLDFDVMISDLAPIDLLIQRAGRLQRHRRGSDGSPISGKDGRSEAVLRVLAPPWTETPRATWVTASLPRTALVYPDHGWLWLTESLLRERGRIAVPDDARDLIEGVYGEEAAERVPKGLRSRANRAEGDRSAKSSLAKLNALILSDGYKSTPNAWLPDTVTPTRLGDPVTNVRLARRDGDQFVPLFENEELGWELSQVSVRHWSLAERLKGSKDEERLFEAAEAEMPDGGRWSVTILLERDLEGWSGRAQAEDGNTVDVRYSQDLGLRVLREEK